MSPRFRSSSRRARARSPTAISCCRSSARSTADAQLTPLGRELAQAAGRSADRPHDPRRERRRLPRRRCWSSPARWRFPIRASGRWTSGRRPIRRTLRFRDERSDFLSLIALWQFFTDALADKLPHRRLVERCRAHFVSYLRLREWRDLHRQLSGAGRRARLDMERNAAGSGRRRALRDDPSGAARRAAVEHRHQSRQRIAGRRQYLGARGDQVLPASGLGHRAKSRRNGCSPPS